MKTNRKKKALTAILLALASKALAYIWLVIGIVVLIIGLVVVIQLNKLIKRVLPDDPPAHLFQVAPGAANVQRYANGNVSLCFFDKKITASRPPFLYASAQSCLTNRLFASEG